METILWAFFFIILFIINKIIEYVCNKKFKTALKQQNKEILIVNYDDIDLLEECFKPNSFFELINNGKNPCEVSKIEYVQYSNEDDYFFMV